MKYKIEKIKKRTIYCLIASIILSAFMFFINKESIYIRPYEIKRGQYGTEKSTYKVQLDAENLEKNLEFNIQVSPRKYLKNEADKIFKDKLEKIFIEILNTNKDFDHISDKLNFKLDLGDGIKANYSFEPNYTVVATISNATKSEADAFKYYTKYQNLIDAYGNVKNSNFRLDEVCTGYIEVQLSTEIKEKDGTYKSEKYMIPIKVISKELSELESFRASFAKEVLKSDQDTINNDNIILPKIINGFKLIYKDKIDFSFLLMPIFGIIIVVLLEAKDKEKKFEEEKKKKRKLENDFSQIISKLLLYVCSGMTIRNSMIKIAVEYQNKLKVNDEIKSFAYDEISIVKNKLLSGYSEIKAYEEMAKNINMRTYTRFLNIVIQSIKTGNKEFKNILNVEVQDALYDRKQRAKKLGEEASTKLVLPLMMMLSVIMVIIMVPAFMGM